MKPQKGTKNLAKAFLIFLLFSGSVAAQSLDDRVKADRRDNMPETMWSVDNPAYLLMSRLSEVIAEGLAKNKP